MNKELLSKHIERFIADSEKRAERFNEDFKERLDLISYYQSFDEGRILSMSEDDLYQYLSRLWAMMIWGNKHYVVDKIIEDNGLSTFRERLATLVWGDADIALRWNDFRRSVKGMGPAMMSEVLCKTHPKEYMIWNRRAYVALNYVQVSNLPRYDYQLTGSVYKELCLVAKSISEILAQVGYRDTTLLAVDYFIWSELQVEDNLSHIGDKNTGPAEELEAETEEAVEFIHNDVRDKVRDIGQWLGFTSRIEQRVSEGSKVDAIWEATIGNMGRVIYVFEVQTKGSIDSLILNLLKSLNNPAVQGVVAISDKKQLDTIKKHASDVKELRDKLRYWDYEEALHVHESLEFVNSSINDLGLVPQGF